MDEKELIRRFKPFMTQNQYNSIVYMYEIADEQGKKRIGNVLKGLHIKIFGEPADDENLIILEPPKPSESFGDYILGEVMYGKQPYFFQKQRGLFGLHEDELIRHTLNIGMSGAGKTNTQMNIVGRLLQKGKPFLVLDQKQTYRSLIQTKEGKDTMVWTMGDEETSPFYWNPLIPMPGVKLMDVLKDNILALASGHFLGQGVFKILKDAMYQAYKDFGAIVDNVPGPPEYPEPPRWPTWKDISEYMDKPLASQRKQQWMDSAMRAVEWINLPGMSETINVPQEIPIEKIIFGHQNIFEMSHLAFWDRKYITEMIFRQLRRHLAGVKHEYEKFRLKIVVEEAHNWFKKESTEAIHLTDDFMSNLPREIREYGIGLDMVTQSPYLFSITAVENTAVTIVHNLKGIQSVDSAASMLGMRGRKKDMILRLGVGQAICTVQGRIHKPFLVQIPKLRLAKGDLTDEDIKIHMIRLAPFMKDKLGISGRPAVSFEFVPEKSDDDAKILESQKETRIVLPEGGMAIIRDSELKLLKDVNKHLSGMRERYKRLGFSVYMGNTARIGLVEKGFVEEVNVPTKSGSTKILTLSEKGKKTLRALNVPISKTKRWGSVEHRYACMELARYSEQFGYSAVVEHPIGGGKEIDILLERLPLADQCPVHPILGKANKIALEYETGSSDLAYNIKKGLDFGCDLVVSIGKNMKVKEKIWDDASYSGLNKNPNVVITTLKEFYSSDPDSEKNPDSVGKEERGKEDS